MAETLMEIVPEEDLGLGVRAKCDLEGKSCSSKAKFLNSFSGCSFGPVL